MFSFLFHNERVVNKSAPLNWLTIAQASKHLGVSRDSLRRWEKKGKLKSYRTPGGQRRYTLYDLELAVRNQSKIPLIAHKPKNLTHHNHQPLHQAVSTETISPPQKAESPKPIPPPPQVSPTRTKPTVLGSPMFILLAALIGLAALLIFSGVGKNLLTLLKTGGEIIKPIPGNFLP